MDVTPIRTLSAQNSTDTPVQSGTGNYNFGSAQFMQMLMAQLTHQNPLEPMSDSEMLSQFAQLNSLEELKSIKNTMEQLVTANQSNYAAGLIGKTIKVSRPDGSSIEGKVTGFAIEHGQTVIQMGKEAVPLDEIVEVREE